jgi:hypothetical protein
VTRTSRSVAAAAGMVLALSACGPTVPPEPSLTLATAAPDMPSAAPTLNRAPQASVTPPKQVDTSDVRMPFALEESVVVDPGWTSLPVELDGVLLAPNEREGLLEFTAVSAAGHRLWTAQRPLDAAGFTVTRTAQGQALAVLTDTTSPPKTRNASAYDLETGDLVWGPVDVPGPLIGPGLVFAATESPSPDDTSSPIALDPDSGTVLAWPGNDQERVLGEFMGAMLIQAQGRLELRTISDDAVVWSVVGSAWEGTVSLANDRQPRDGLLILEVGKPTRVLINLDTGHVITDDILDAVLDPTTLTIVATHPDGLRAIDRDGEPLWANPTADDAALHCAQGALVYTRVGPAIRVHNIVTGAVALAYEDSGSAIAVPEQFFPTGAAVITVNGRLLLATAG